MRWLNAVKLPFFFLFAASTLPFTSGCYREQPASGVIDLSEVPERVALLVPAEGISVDFGPTPQNETRELSLHIVNAGPNPAANFKASDQQEPSPFSFKGGEFPGTGGTCTADVGPESMCTIVVEYTPTNAGPHSGTLKMEYVNGVLVFPLNIEFTGTTAAILEFSDGGVIDFGIKAVGSSTTGTLTVTNTGSLPAESIEESALSTLTAPFSFSGGAYPGTGGDCSDTLAPEESCTIELQFDPTDPGNFTGEATIAFETEGLPQVATLSLEGRTPAILEFTDGLSFDFERHVAGSTTDKSLTLSNVGGATATAIQEKVADTLAPPFSFKGGSFPGIGGSCTSELPSGESCTLVATFEPDEVPSADYSDALTIEYNGGLAVENVAITLDGRGQLGWDGSGTPAPSGRHLHSAVWNGTHMIVWGGKNAGEYFSDGAKYDPKNDTWAAISASGILGRIRHTAVWAGNLGSPKMIIWGGQRDNGSALQTGAMYNPQLDQWTAMSSVGAPSARYGHTAIWDPVRKKMIVWGGAGDAVENTRGFLFDPEAGAGGTWSAIDDGLASTPTARYHHSAVWTGTHMIIWGGCLVKDVGAETCVPGNETNTGSIFNPANSTWTPIDPTDAPSARFLHSAVWNGSRMIIFGGATDTGPGNLVPVNSGAVYTLPADGEAWDLTPALNAPLARAGHLAFWTAEGMVVWGGLANSGAGAILNPALSTWTALPGGAPVSTSGTTGVYTGGLEARILIFGGLGLGPIYSNITAILSP